MKIQMIQGCVESLRITRTKKNILFEESDTGNVATVGAIGLAIAGLSSAAAQTASHAGDTSDEVEAYIVSIDSQDYCGVTRKFSMKVGDRVHAVVRGNECIAIYCPATRFISMPPYTSRGHKAGIIYGFRCYFSFVAFFALFGFAASVLAMATSDPPHDIYWKIIIPAITLSGVWAFPLMAIFLGPRFYKFAVQATIIFEQFGFDKPEWIDLKKSSNMYLSRYGIPESSNPGLQHWY